MIRSLHFKQFKSFIDTRMDMQQLTILIGSNASGKSNAIDGLRILSESVSGLDLSLILDGMRSKANTGIRGGSVGCPRYGTDTFTLGVTVTHPDTDGVELYYEVSITVADRIFVSSESLTEIRDDDAGGKTERMLFHTVPGRHDSGDIAVEYNNQKKGRNPQFECLKFASVLSQLSSRLPDKTQAQKHIHEMARCVVEQLRNVLFLDPIPHEMRDYVPHTSTELLPTASNLSAVFANIASDKKKKKLVLGYLKDLPDQEILDVDTVKTQLGDVMLRIKERLGDVSAWIDARGLSDGTLRSLAVMSALLSEQPRSLIVIEEVDNGLHPSKARSIFRILTEVSRDRGLGLLVTTHNPALLNAVTAKETTGIVVCYRDRNLGDSKFRSLVDLDLYLRIASNERIGDAMESGEITRAVREKSHSVSDDVIEWLRSL